MQIRTMRIYKRYFNMIKSGQKTIEVRVAYPSMSKIKVGDIIKFNGDADCACTVLRISRYTSFAEMMSKEDPSKINPYDNAENQLEEIRKIFPPHKEKLGVLAFEIKKL